MFFGKSLNIEQNSINFKQKSLLRLFLSIQLALAPISFILNFCGRIFKVLTHFQKVEIFYNTNFVLHAVFRKARKGFSMIKISIRMLLLFKISNLSPMKSQNLRRNSSNSYWKRAKEQQITFDCSDLRDGLNFWPPVDQLALTCGSR